MAKFIALVQLKGGSGRSTLATNIAGYFASKMPTGLIDADMPQGTSASWASLRQGQPDLFKDGLLVRTATTHAELIEAAKELDQQCKLVIIDTPPRTQEITRAALMIADLALVPIGASASELWACSDLIEVINEAKLSSPELDAQLVWTRIRAVTNTAKELTALAGKELGLPALKTKISYRVAYVEAIGRGLTVMQWHDKQAQEEITALTKEIIKRIKP